MKKKKTNYTKKVRVKQNSWEEECWRKV